MSTGIALNQPLSIDEIDFRIQSINKGGFATILAYKDARVDMNRLDAVYGVEGWQNKYELINGNLFCSIGIFSQSQKQWIWKQNVGTESNTEKEKGQASDAFKRAGFNLGIGRELYEYPVIQVKLFTNEFTVKNDKAYATWDLKLKEWKWESEFDGCKIVKLKAIDQQGNPRYSWTAESPASKPKTKELPPLLPNTPEWKTAIDFLNNGYEDKNKVHKEGTIPLLRKRFKISEKNEELLMEQSI